MQQFPHQQMVQCPHCGGCSVPSAPLPPGTVVACPTCRQSFVYQPNAGRPNAYGAMPPAFPPARPAPVPAYAPLPQQPLGRTLPAQGSGDNSQIYLVAAVVAAGLLIVALLLTLVASSNRQVARDNPQESAADSPPKTAKLLSQSDFYPTTSFRTPPTQEEAAKQVEAELARVAKIGEPLTVDQLRTYYVARGLSHDKTEMWLAALNDLSAKGVARDSSDYGRLISMIERPVNGSSDAMMKIVERNLLKVNAQLDAVVALGHDPGECRFPVEFEKGMTAMLDHGPLVRYAVQHLAARARFQLLRSQRDELYGTLIAMISVARTLDEGLTLLEQAVRVTTLEIACGSISDAVQHGNLTVDQVDNLALAVSNVDLSHAAYRGTICWRVFTIMSWEDPDALGRGIVQESINLPPKASARDRAFSLGFQARMLDAQGAELWNRIDKMDSLQRDFTAISKFSGSVRDDYSYSLLTCKDLSGLAKVFSRTEAIRVTTHAALKGRAFRLRNNRWPESLAECGVTVAEATDPFDGKPLRYRTGAESFVVYSIGKDRKDDGGRELGLTGKSDVGIELGR